ncbi:protein containing DUF1788 [Candidatus Magnetomorum sp. HK-1]|nr:protein containing DUF1788 [Candidatus Magnetomorum sp. HK-1]
MIGYLKQRKLLDRAIQIQLKKGDQELLKAIKGTLGADKLAKAFVTNAEPQNNESGIGIGNWVCVSASQKP